MLGIRGLHGIMCANVADARHSRLAWYYVCKHPCSAADGVALQGKKSTSQIKHTLWRIKHIWLRWLCLYILGQIKRTWQGLG